VIYQFVVYGTPGPQGSKSFKGMRRNKEGKSHAVLVESSKKVKPWREAVMDAANEAIGTSRQLDGPLRVTMIFTLRKPTSAPKRRRTWPVGPPDLSKLVRSTEDALTACGFWKDDARVVELTAVKTYPLEDYDALDEPGALIRVEEVLARPE